jgi:hypothetical protein
VLGFVLRGARPRAVLFASAFVARNALDMLRPTTDFSTRSEVSTALAAGILLSAGFWTAWRSGSFAAGVAAGLATTAIAAVLDFGGTAALLAIWHDPRTMTRVRQEATRSILNANREAKLEFRKYTFGVRGGGQDDVSFKPDFGDGIVGAAGHGAD